MKTTERNQKKIKPVPRARRQIENSFHADWDYRKIGQDPLIMGWRQYIKERRAKLTST
jgi:hypothetical protein